MATDQSAVRDDASRDASERPISYEIIFESVADHYKQDLREFFTRANFYLAVHTALLSAVGIRDAPNSKSDWAIILLIALAGIVLACVWGSVSYGAVLWIRRWRKELQRLSRELSPTHSYHRLEDEANEHRYQSPEELTKFLPWFFAIIWLCLPIALWITSSG